MADLIVFATYPCSPLWDCPYEEKTWYFFPLFFPLNFLAFIFFSLAGGGGKKEGGEKETEQCSPLTYSAPILTR